MNINDRIRAVRKTHSLTQAEFGRRIGLSRDSVANMENGRMRISNIQISSIARAFNVSESWLRTGDGPMTAPVSREEEIRRIVAQIMDGGEDNPFYSAVLAMVTYYDRLNAEGKAILDKAMEVIMSSRLPESENLDSDATASEDIKKSPAAGQELDIDAEVAAYRAELEAQMHPEAGSSLSGTTEEAV